MWENGLRKRFDDEQEGIRRDERFAGNVGAREQRLLRGHEMMC